MAPRMGGHSIQLIAQVYMRLPIIDTVIQGYGIIEYCVAAVEIARFENLQPGSWPSTNYCSLMQQSQSYRVSFMCKGGAHTVMITDLTALCAISLRNLSR